MYAKTEQIRNTVYIKCEPALTLLEKEVKNKERSKARINHVVSDLN